MTAQLDDLPEDFQENDTDDIELVPGAELGNMFLVRINGELKRKANTSKNKLLYKHGLHSLLQSSGGRTVLSEDPYIAVEPTHNDDVYTIWHGREEFPVMNPPSKAEDVLRGVIDALEHSDFSTLKDVYRYVRDNQVRREVVNKLLPKFQPKVVKQSEGWVVNGMFLLTWEAEVFLITTDLDEGSFIVRGGISETDETREFLKITPEESPEPKTMELHGEKFELGELEMLFLAKAQYLINFRERLDDEAFYAVLQRHIADRFKETDDDADDRL